ncbi:MAG: hypothetical protein AAGJ35_15040, partial [Myxococcota bacterium]
RQLTGKLFQFHLTSEATTGYTRLDQDKIFLNPTPLLQQEPHAKELLQGLILHEIGHHLYHASPEAQQIWKQAEQQHIHLLLNLVADEHLERNLRAYDSNFGDRLKRLVAYGFQHRNNHVHIDTALDHLGCRAFSFFQEHPITPSPQLHHIILPSHALLQNYPQQAELTQFIRALRLGQRRSDAPNVQRALALFPKSFRNASMQQLFSIAKQLHHLFGVPSPILHAFSIEEDLGLPTQLQLRMLRGLQDHHFQHLRQRPNATHFTSSEYMHPTQPKRNQSSQLQFAHIRTIRVLPYRESHAQPYRAQIRGFAQNLRQYLLRFGLQHQPQPRRWRGTQLDRTALRSSLLLKDPRLLKARVP